MYRQGQRQPYGYNNPNPKEGFLNVFCMKNCFYAYNLFFILMGLTLLGIGIWMSVDRNFMAVIMDNALYAVAAYIMIGVGAIVVIISFFGCFGSQYDNKTLLWIYLATVVFITFSLLVITILAFVFRDQLGQSIKDKMKETLTEDYGTKLNRRWNRAVTRAWDRAQEKLECCAVEDYGWDDYRDSEWFDDQLETPDVRRPYVPRTCCVRDRFWRYVNLDTCQKWTMGPPGSLDEGSATNPALYYEGCYEAGKRFVKDNGLIIGIIAIVFAVFMVLGILISFYLLRNIKEKPVPKEKPRDVSSFPMTEVNAGYMDT